MEIRKRIYWIVGIVALLVVAAVGTLAASGGGSQGTLGVIEHEKEFHGVVQSFTDTELVLDNGTIVTINENTRIETTLSVGAELEVEGFESNGKVIASEIEADDFDDGS